MTIYVKNTEKTRYLYEILQNFFHLFYYHKLDRQENIINKTNYKK